MNTRPLLPSPLPLPLLLSPPLPLPGPLFFPFSLYLPLPLPYTHHQSLFPSPSYYLSIHVLIPSSFSSLPHSSIPTLLIYLSFLSLPFQFVLPPSLPPSLDLHSKFPLFPSFFHLLLSLPLFSFLFCFLFSGLEFILFLSFYLHLFFIIFLVFFWFRVRFLPVFSVNLFI